MRAWQLNGLSILFFGLSTVACVGPTTPFGPLDSSQKIKSSNNSHSENVASKYEIFFHPEAQVLHDKADFSIEIKSSRPMPDDLKIQITHNEFDVTEAFLANSSIHKSADNKTRIYLMKDVRLKTLDTNEIQVRILDSANITMVSDQFSPPECSMFSENRLAHLGSFHAPENYIDLIERISDGAGANPNFLAGIVAQESGFNPKAVSWAKAIGLTQITPLAERQVMQSLTDWPRYPGINDLSYITLKSKIFMGEIDKEKEWRLNPERSLEGGMTYIQYLERYWNLNENKKLVENLEGDYDKVLTELILASYNSGAARVKKAVQSKKNHWKKHPSLKEAVKYVKRVSSYCFHYTKREVENDNET